jgi:hypothetical protein
LLGACLEDIPHRCKPNITRFYYIKMPPGT